MQAAHRVSYELHKGIIPEGLYVRHSCDNPACVNPEHLLLGTQKDNMKDMINRNRQSKGSKRFCAKLNEQQVIEIRNLYATGNYTYADLAKMYGLSVVSRSSNTIRYIIARKTWKHL